MITPDFSLAVVSHYQFDSLKPSGFRPEKAAFFRKKTLEKMMIISNNRTVEYFAQAINKARQNSANAALETARLAYEAHRELADQDHDRLATLARISLSKLSKLRTIHSHREQLLKYIADIPAEWTVLYDIVCLSDRQFLRLVDEKKLRPDLTSKEIATFATTAETHSAEDQKGSMVIATIRTSDEIAQERLEKLRKSIQPALKKLLKGVVVQVSFPERKSDRTAKARLALREKLAAELGQRLAKQKQVRASLSPVEYEQLSNAAWQHQHQKQKGKYPYDSSDTKSIEHTNHPYSVKKAIFSNRKKFLAYLRRTQIPTPFSKIPDHPEFAAESCIQLALQYCEATGARTRRVAKKKLAGIAGSRSVIAGIGRKYLNMIEEGGAL